MPSDPKPPDPYIPHRPIPGKPIISAYPTPSFLDRIYKMRKDSRDAGYEIPEQGSPPTGPDAEKYKDFLFSTIVPTDQTGWVDWIFVNERANQDAYNYTITYPWEDQTFPQVTRTYLILRSKYAPPDPTEHDSVYTDCVLVDQKETRFEDIQLDAIFVGVTKVFERIPAETTVVLDRPEHSLPFNFRVAVPAVETTTIEQGAVKTGETIDIVNEEDWSVDETTRTVFSRTQKRKKRVIPDGSFTLNKARRLTREQQLGQRTETWAIGGQEIVPRATTIEASVEDVGNNTTVKDETVVPRVFPGQEFKAELANTFPLEFRAYNPVITESITSEGQAELPVVDFTVGELERASKQETELIKRDTVVRQPIVQLPKTLIDHSIDGVHAHGSEFNSVCETDRTLAVGDQPVEEGLQILKSNVKDLGNGLSLRETTKLEAFSGPHLLLTDGGEGYECDPAVVFSEGQIGEDAAGTAVISAIPPTGGTPPGEDNGGVFDLGFNSFGDANGVFTFLGARYNSGVWTNPATAGDIAISVNTDGYTTQDQLAQLVDHAESNVNAYKLQTSGDSPNFIIDLGIGRVLRVDTVTLRQPSSAYTLSAAHIDVDVSNDGINWANVATLILPTNQPNAWVASGSSRSDAWRYIRIQRSDREDPQQSGLTALRLGEVELYGELTIVPASNHVFLYPGDNQGVFFDLGKRGGGGTWRNPATNGDIVLTADAAITGDLNAIVDRQPSNTYYTDPAHTPAAYNFDLGSGRSLICNKITYRQRTAFGSNIQSFNLQGRNNLADPMDWHNLVTVNPSQTPDAWTVADVPGAAGYRQFRIISQQSYFTIGELELYGALDLGPPPAPTYGVTSVQITDGGHDYVVAPFVRFSGGGGTGAAGTAIITNGVVTSVNVTSSGMGYTSAPDVGFLIVGGGKNATATANISTGQIASCTVNNPGEEYEAPPLVTIVGTGSGALAHSQIDAAGRVIAIVMDNHGSGYTIATIVIQPAGGPVAVAHVGYGADAITVTNGGSGYDHAPAVTVGGGANGVQAHSILGYPVASVTITDRGTGYTSDPTPVFAGATGATGAAGTSVRGFPIASVTYTPSGATFANAPTVGISGGGPYGQDLQLQAIVGRPVLAITVGIQGTNYSSDVAVGITGDGSGAAATAIRSFRVASLGGGTGGTGFTEATVLIGAPTGANGIQATAHATISGGAVASIVLDNAGYGYLSAPTVTVTGDGTGNAGATAALETTGAIDHVNVTAGGTGHSAPPTVSLTATSGSGAVLTATLDNSVPGRLVKIVIVNPGSGYNPAPTLILPAGAATATAVLSTAGNVVAVNLSAGGTGYRTPGTVGFTGGGGTGAAGLEVLSPTGSVTAVVIDNAGTGLTAGSQVIFSGGGGTGAAATITIGTGGSVIELDLIDPGPQYTVAPLVSFEGCLPAGAGGSFVAAGSLVPIHVFGSGTPGTYWPGEYGHVAVLLQDGRVMIGGGFSNSWYDYQIYDPVGDSWSVTGSLLTGQDQEVPYLAVLPSGNVIVACGSGSGAVSYIWNKSTGLWNTGSPIATNHDRTDEGAVCTLNNGKILIAGGRNTSFPSIDNNVETTAELFDEGGGTWVPTAVMNHHHIDPLLIPLADGRAMIVGCGRLGQPAGKKCEIYDPVGDTWTDTGDLNVGRSWEFTRSGGLQLPSGKVLVVGGQISGTGVDGPFQVTCELWDPVSEMWSLTTGSLHNNGYALTITLLDNGLVLRVGGDSDANPNGEPVSELFDPMTQLWTLGPSLSLGGRDSHTATKLLNGKVLIAAGSINSGDQFSTSAELYTQGGPGGRSAAALYILGSSWPVLYDTITDPVEKIVVDIEKRIVPAGTQLPTPAGFIDIYALDKYRSIQITSAVDLTRLPLPDTFGMTHFLELPPILKQITATYNIQANRSVDISTAFGGTSVKSSVKGRMFAHIVEGYRGPAVASVIRSFMFGPPAPSLIPAPLVIRPSTGTVYLSSSGQEHVTSVGVRGGFGFINESINNDSEVDALDLKGVLTGNVVVGASSGVQSVDAVDLQASAIARAQTAGFFFDGFRTSVSQNVVNAEATLTAAIPASSPASIDSGTTFLVSAVVEKWRFGIYVMVLTYVTVP